MNNFIIKHVQLTYANLKQPRLFGKREKRSHCPGKVIANILMPVFSDIFLCTDTRAHEHTNMCPRRLNVSLYAF